MDKFVARMNAEGFTPLMVKVAVRTAVATMAKEFENAGHAGGWRDGEGAVPFASIEEAMQYFDNDAAIEVVIYGGMEIVFYLNGKQIEYKKFKNCPSGIILVEEWSHLWEEWDRQGFYQELDWIASGHVPEAEAVSRAAAFLRVEESNTLIEAVRRELAALRHKNGY